MSIMLLVINIVKVTESYLIEFCRIDTASQNEVKHEVSIAYEFKKTLKKNSGITNYLYKNFMC